jgi:hypothetical protein
LDIWLVFFPPGCVVVSLDSDAICASSALPVEKNPTPTYTIYFVTVPNLAPTWPLGSKPYDAAMNPAIQYRIASSFRQSRQIAHLRETRPSHRFAAALFAGRARTKRPFSALAQNLLRFIQECKRLDALAGRRFLKWH